MREWKIDLAQRELEFLGYEIRRRDKGRYDFTNPEGEGFMDITEDKLRAILALMWQKVF